VIFGVIFVNILMWTIANPLVVIETRKLSINLIFGFRIWCVCMMGVVVTPCFRIQCNYFRCMVIYLFILCQDGISKYLVFVSYK